MRTNACLICGAMDCVDSHLRFLEPHEEREYPCPKCGKNDWSPIEVDLTRGVTVTACWGCRTRFKVTPNTLAEDAPVPRLTADSVYKALGGKPGLVAQEWATYDEKVLPKTAGEIQRTETRRAFYAGAHSLLSLLMKTLDADQEPTPADLERMDAIDRELKQFYEDMKRGKV